MDFNELTKGWMVKNDLLGGKVERQTGPIKRDFLGIVDFVGFDKKGKGILIQVTSKSNISSHRKKIREHPNTPLCIQRGLKIILLTFVKFENHWKEIEEEIFPTPNTSS